MLKRISIVIVILLVLTGCTSTYSSDQIKLQKYETYYSDVMNNEVFNASSSFFDVETVMVALDNNQYRYDIYIDNPKVAMYDISVLAVENNLDISETNGKMMPFHTGIESNTTNMIPFQSNLESGFVKGLVLSGVVDSDRVNIKMLVQWQDYGNVKTYKEFLEFEITLPIELETAE